MHDIATNHKNDEDACCRFVLLANFIKRVIVNQSADVGKKYL